ncbi:MAG: N-(5'-phosphoribosyl)anthranilate isomerase, partial [Deltaproteobacteria bacterium]|nr:N-(5'-phosphoribosyl)anthranilate isomerase [Deltaproteobacteria bacterium]
MEAVRIKICGSTNIYDAAISVEAGADALGFVFWEKSPRAIRVKEAGDIISKLPPFISTVGVFVNEDPDRINSIVKDAGLSVVQLHGDEGPEVSTRISAKVIKAFRIRDIRDIKG